MSTKIQMFAVIGILYVILSTSYYEVVINIVMQKRPTLNEFKRLKQILNQSGDLNEINRLLAECDELYLSIKEDAIFLYNAFTMISILSIMNFSFVTEHIITYLVTKRLDRFYTMP